MSRGRPPSLTEDLGADLLDRPCNDVAIRLSLDRRSSVLLDVELAGDASLDGFHDGGDAAEGDVERFGARQ